MSLRRAVRLVEPWRRHDQPPAGREGESLTDGPTVPHFGADHFGLQVADVDAAIAELRKRGVTIDVEPYDFTPGSRIAYVRGPDGVRIQLVQSRR